MADTNQPQAAAELPDISIEELERMSPAEQRKVAHTLREMAVFVSQVSEEDLRKFQEIPWEKLQRHWDPSMGLTEEDKESYRRLWQLVQDGHVNMAQVLGYSQEELTRSYTLGQNLCAQGKFDDALKIADGLLALAPTFIAAHLLKAEALRKQEKYEEALNHYNQAVAADPMFIQSYWERAKLFFAIENGPNFLMDINSVASLDPEARTVFGKRARTLLEAAEREALKAGYTPEQIAEAEDQLEAAMVEHPAEEFPQIDKDGNQIVK